MLKNKVLAVTKKVLWGIVLTIFGIIAVIAVWLMVDKYILRSPVPSVFGYASLTVETGSMAGTIEIGDMIIIKDQDEYKIGDIITFMHEGDKIPTTHRIINYNQDGSFVTKGDSNNTKDPAPVTEENILGEVIKVIPNVGIFAAWVQTEGWIYIVACLAILGLGMFILNSDDEEDEENEAAESPEETSEQSADEQNGTAALSEKSDPSEQANEADSTEPADSASSSALPNEADSTDSLDGTATQVSE